MNLFLTEYGEYDDEGEDVVEQDAGEAAGEVEGGAQLVVSAAVVALAAHALE